MEFGEKLKKAREEKGMTQQTLADKLYVTRQAVSRWERGERYPDLMTAKCVASILQVTLDSMLSDDEMKDYSKRQALLSAQKQGKLMTALYTTLAVLSFLIFLPDLVFMGLNLANGHFTLSANDFPPIVGMLGYGTLFVMAIIFAFTSIKKGIEPKCAGMIGIVYCAFYALYSVAIIIMTNQNPIKNRLYEVRTAYLVTVNILLYLLVIVVIYRYFVAKNDKWFKWVMISGILLIIKEVYPVIHLQYQMNQFTQDAGIVEITVLQQMDNLFANVLIFLIMLIQAYFLKKLHLKKSKES